MNDNRDLNSRAPDDSLDQLLRQELRWEAPPELTLRLLGFFVITAILLAGRTDSAFTAELGAMKMRQEIDALRVLGVDPMEALVVPRVLAMLVMTPVLTFVAVIAGLLGGMLVSWLALDVSPVLFVNRIHENVPWRHFWVGMVKAPVFAILIALVGCFEGLRVSGSAESVGKMTTRAVVEGIFLVIIFDALFSVLFSILRI